MIAAAAAIRRSGEMLTTPRLERVAAAALSVAATAALAIGFDLIDGRTLNTVGASTPTYLFILPRLAQSEHEPEPTAERPKSSRTRRPVQVENTASDTEAITFVPPEPTTPIARDPAAGLRSLLSRDPCLDRIDRLTRPECPPILTPGDALGDRETKIADKVERDQFLSFAKRKNCSVKHGCLDDLSMEQTLGLKPPPRGSTMATGVNSGGGPGDSVPRLGPPNWYHVDRGFGD